MNIIKKIIKIIKNNIKEYKKNTIRQLGYKPLKDKKDEDFVTLFKKTIRTRKSRTIESELENIMFECNLYNKSGEYAWHLNTIKDKNNPNHYTTYWKIPRGLTIHQYMDKQQFFSDSLTAQCIVEPRNGTLCIDVWEGVIPQKAIYNFNYENYKDKYLLPIPIGVNQMGLYVWDLYEKIHILIAGTTGGGKSILMTSWVDALLQNSNTLLFIIDLALTDFYHTRNHCIFSGDLIGAEIIIDYLRQELDKRRYLLTKFNVREIKKFNEKYPQYKLPYLILFIDEFAFTVPSKYLNKEEKQLRQKLQAKIAELGQAARKCGIHLIISMQKPVNTLIPTELKTHFPGRISFKMSDKGSSMTILDCTDAFYLSSEKGKLIAMYGTKKIQAQALYLDPEIAEQRMSMFDRFNQYEKYCNYNRGDKFDEWQYKFQHQKKRLLPRQRS